MQACKHRPNGMVGLGLSLSDGTFGKLFEHQS